MKLMNLLSVCLAIVVCLLLVGCNFSNASSQDVELAVIGRLAVSAVPDPDNPGRLLIVAYDLKPGGKANLNFFKTGPAIDSGADVTWLVDAAGDIRFSLSAQDSPPEIIRGKLDSGVLRIENPQTGEFKPYTLVSP